MKNLRLAMVALLFPSFAASNLSLAVNSLPVIVSTSPVCLSHLLNMAKILADPFPGVYTISSYGQIIGNVTITHAGGNQYKIDSGDGYDIGTKNGLVLEGTSNGFPFRILVNGNNLIMEVLGMSMELTRVSGTVNTETQMQTQAPSSIPQRLDQRLLGVWRYTHIQKSGSAQIVTDYRIGFKNDGTYNTKSEWAGMGSSGEEPQRFGQYQIVSMNDSGGVVKLDGNDQEYFFSGKSVKIGTTIYEFIRK